jgi:hypothetical protein
MKKIIVTVRRGIATEELAAEKDLKNNQLDFVEHLF